MAIGKHGAVVRQLRTLFNVGTIGELTDGQLLERFATGGGEVAELAFAALVERHGPMVLRVCRGVLADSHDTQDAFQATFLVLVRKARGLWVRDSLGPWLYQVAYRTASCHRLAAARRQRHEQGAAVLRQEACIEEHDDLAGVLHEEIGRLPERFRAPLILCDLEGRSHEQAARHLGWPVGTVKSRQARGRERLRERLRHRGVAPDAAVLAAALRPDGASALVSPALVDSTIRAASQFVALRTLVPGSAVSLAQGVLSSMYVTQWFKVVLALVFLGATATGVGLLAQKGTPVVVPGPDGHVQAARPDEVATTKVEAGKFNLTVIERGSLEASRTASAYCLVDGRTTIIKIRPDTTLVKKGQVVCELDSAPLKDQLTNQEITVKSAETNYKNAKLAREVAETAVIEYNEAIYKQDRKTVKDAVAIAQTAMQKAEARLERTRLARKRLRAVAAEPGQARTPADILAELDVEDRLESAEITLLREKAAFDQARIKQDRLEKVIKPKTIRELQAEVERTRSVELAKKRVWEVEINQVRKLERQVLNCTIRAPRDGTLVLANDPTRFVGRPPQIEEGATVRERQKIFSVVDLSGPMQVNTKVHESLVDKIHRNMRAKISVDAFPNETLNGTVIDVFPLPDATTFASPDIKVYTTRVKIDQPLPGLKPGMTARVDILVSELDNVLSVPVEAIVHYNEKDHVAVKKTDGAIEWRDVTLGQSNGQLVEVKQGIKSGELVVTRPQALLSEEQRRSIRNSPASAQPAVKPSGL